MSKKRSSTSVHPSSFILHPSLRRICFVTGTRAEFGLMRRVLEAIDAHPKLKLQIIVTGMHLDRSRGLSARSIKADARVPWRDRNLAAATGNATAGIARQLDRLKSDVVLVVGDRVEAFAAATAGHLSGRVVAHVHGGDRALGLVDDSLRHAITKLAHIHFPATRESAERIKRLGEEPWRIHTVGSPGIDGIMEDARPVDESKHALLVLHPACADERVEFQRAQLVLDSVLRVAFPQVVVVYPNNDPGAEGIARCWGKVTSNRVTVHRNLERGQFLGLVKQAAVLVGNSSSGIIEAASFGTPVIDIGPRQQGRQRSQDVVNVPYRKSTIVRELLRVWNDGRPRRWRGANVYGGQGTGRKVASVLASLRFDRRILQKLIAY